MQPPGQAASSVQPHTWHCPLRSRSSDMGKKKCRPSGAGGGLLFRRTAVQKYTSGLQRAKLFSAPFCRRFWGVHFGDFWTTLAGSVWRPRVATARRCPMKRAPTARPGFRVPGRAVGQKCLQLKTTSLRGPWWSASDRALSQSLALQPRCSNFRSRCCSRAQAKPVFWRA